MNCNICKNKLENKYKVYKINKGETMKDTKRLFELCSGVDAILVTSQKNRFYFTNFSSTAGYLLLSKKGNVFVTDFRYAEMAAPLKNEGVEVIITEAGRTSGQIINEKIDEFGIKTMGFEDTEMTYADYQRYKAAFEKVELVPVGKDIEFVRRYKTQEELDNIAKAQAITDKVFDHMLTVIKPGLTEIDLAVELECTIRRLGGDGIAFDTIIASGENSSKPHAHPTTKKIVNGDPVTMDFGAKFNGYCSDMTRTVFVGSVSDEMKKIYETVLAAQMNVLNNMKPGMTGKELDALARDLITEAGYGQYFQHSTGHSLGLDIHESPNLSSLCDIIFEPTMLGTVEPGIYVAGLGGVRIEDLVIFTQDGIKDLTTSSKEIIIL